MRIQAAVLVGVLVASVGGAASDAHACGFFNYHEARPVPRKAAPVPVAKAAPKPAPVPASERIAAADQRLDEERLSLAGAQVVAAFPTIKTMDVAKEPLETRAHCILALALVRSGGSLAGVEGFSSAREAERAANVEWAVSTLRQVEAARHEDPVAQANLGEALAARGTYEEEAVRILGGLASRDSHGERARVRGARAPAGQPRRGPRERRRDEALRVDDEVAGGGLPHATRLRVD